ncbi:hypothetical protein M0802_016769 [Mischocyttarus mexicanus]|nr:hypothetical protein M0802_016769 [Mischocyttarus mexicanus]
MFRVKWKWRTLGTLRRKLLPLLPLLRLLLLLLLFLLPSVTNAKQIRNTEVGEWWKLNAQVLASRNKLNTVLHRLLPTSQPSSQPGYPEFRPRLRDIYSASSLPAPFHFPLTSTPLCTHLAPDGPPAFSPVLTVAAIPPCKLIRQGKHAKEDRARPKPTLD